MLHNEFIIADLAFREAARSRADERDFYETHGKASVARPALNDALAAVRAAIRRLGKAARHLHVGSNAHAAVHPT